MGAGNSPGRQLCIQLPLISGPQPNGKIAPSRRY